MANAVRATILGQDYQHRYFWIQACRLFCESRLVRGVALEKAEVKAFDDVLTAYQQPVYDAHGRLIDGDFFQLKFHVDFAREIRGSDLIEPKFIGATAYSLFHKLAEATVDGDVPRRMTLVTPWAIKSDDPLRVLVSNRDGEMILDPLFSPRATRAMKALRESWRDAIGGPDVTDDRIRSLLRHLRIRQNVPLWQIDEMLDAKLAMAGLAPIDRTKLGDPYLGLSEAFVKSRVFEHDAAGLEKFLRQEGLWVGRPAAFEGQPLQLGIKSFSPFAYELEDEVRVLNLLPFFHGRAAASDVSWNGDLYNPVREFLLAQIKAGGNYDLHFDTHLSIGFAAGWILDKAGAIVTPIQRFPNGQRLRWPDEGTTQDGPLWETAREINVGDGPETALAIEVTHPVSEDVAIYLKRSAPQVGKIVVFTIAGGPSRTSVRDGKHAHALALSLCSSVRDIRPAADRTRPLHVFAAAPVALAFLIGRQAAPWGPTITYEYDFDTKAPGAYSPAFHLPPTREETR